MTDTPVTQAYETKSVGQLTDDERERLLEIVEWYECPLCRGESINFDNGKFCIACTNQGKLLSGTANILNGMLNLGWSSSTASSVEPTRVQKYLADEATARERLATFPDAVRQRLTKWQEGQSEWFSATVLEIVAEFITFDDASLANTPAASSGGADDEQPGDYLRDNLLNIAAICEAKHLLVEAASLRDTAAIVSDQLRKSSAPLAASSHPASAISDATRRMEETLGAKFVPASAGDEGLREALADAFCAGWDARHDGQNYYESRDNYVTRALSATPAQEVDETERLRIAQLERYLRRARRFIGSQPCKIADDIDAYFATDKGEVSRG